jgi:hypothetical protein
MGYGQNSVDESREKEWVTLWLRTESRQQSSFGRRKEKMKGRGEVHLSRTHHHDADETMSDNEAQNEVELE